MSNTGIINASFQTIVSPASRDLLGSNTAPIGVNLTQFKPAIPILNKFETKCLMIQLGNLESNTDRTLTSIGVPSIGIFTANISTASATVTLSNADNSQLLLGMVANTQAGSFGQFGSNTTIIAKSIGGNILAGNFVPGCTYTITSVGTTDFTSIGAAASTIDTVFVANAVGVGTGTASGTNNQIVLGSNNTVSGDISFTVSPVKLGRYQISQWLLISQGYLAADGSWTGKNGIDSSEVFLGASGVQDSIMREFFQTQYVELIKAGALRIDDSKEIVSGMLALAYQYQDLGNPQFNQSIYNSNGTINLETYSIATKANVWRNTGQTLDSQARPGHIYFNGGKYAIGNLGADTQ